MTTIRDDAGAAPSRSVPLDDRSMVPSIMGLRWWVTLLIALVLTLAGVTADILRTGQLGLVYTVCFPVGCVLAAVWARRSELFGPMVQPPLLLAVGVPAVVVATGSLPRAGGLTSTLIAVAGPLINGFPAMAITTAVVLALGFVRWRLQPTSRSQERDAEAARPARPGPQGGARPARPSAGPDHADRPDRPRSPARDDRSPGGRGSDDRGPGDRSAGVYRVGRDGDVERGRRSGPPAR